MMTAACLFGILILVVALVCIFYGCCTDTTTWFWNVIVCDSMGTLCKAIGFLIQAIVEANRE